MVYFNDVFKKNQTSQVKTFIIFFNNTDNYFLIVVKNY